jgi:hypothetical protein
MSLRQEKVENDTHLGIESTSIHWLEKSKQVVGGQVNIAGLNHG